MSFGDGHSRRAIAIQNIEDCANDPHVPIANRDDERVNGVLCNAKEHFAVVQSDVANASV